MALRRLSPVLVLSMLLAGVSAAEEIHTAARAGDLERLAALLETDPSLAERADDRQCRPLHFAADGGQVQALQLLCAAGASLEVRDVDGDTPLHWAAASGQSEAVNWLLEEGAAIDARNHHEDTPLLYAVKRHHFDTTEQLVARGGDLELANDYGRTPLLWTVREGGDLQMSRLLLRLGADVNARDRFGATSLDLAAWRGFKTLCDILLDAGAEVDITAEETQNLLAEAAGRGITRLYRKLVAAGFEVPVASDEHGSLLHLAAAGGSAEIVADLVARGARTDVLDAYGWTPLHHAASRRRPAAAAELLQHVTDPDVRTPSGYSALNLADEKDAAAVVTALRQGGADASPRRFPQLSGPYMGQAAPGDQPRLFAPDIVSGPAGQHGSISFSPDGREAFWSGYTDIPDSGYSYGTIITSREVDGRWTAPRLASFAAERRGDDVPFFAADGQRLFFLSRRPLAPDQPGGKENIWTVERRGDAWGEPQPLPATVNRFDHHWQVSIAANGNLYFASRQGSEETAGIYRSRFVGGAYAEPEFLGLGGQTPFIAPDESYLLTFDFTDAGRHNFIRFRRDDGGWNDAIDLTEATGGGIGGLCPTVSPDGRYFFFLSSRAGTNNTWWVEADFIEGLRP